MGLFLVLLALFAASGCAPSSLARLCPAGGRLGICGLAVLFGMPWVDRIYAAHAGHGLAGILLRALVSALCLLAPILLMGASLPALARQWESTPRGASRLGFLYGANTAGAVAGCVLGGFYLLRLHDMHIASYVAVALNLIVALAALALSRYWPALGAFADHTASAASRSRVAYIVIGPSGLCALGAEVVWTRLLSLMLGATVYALSVILAVFLAGLGIGSAAGSFLSRTRISPRLALGVCQLSLAAAVTGTAFLLTKQIPYWPVVTSPNRYHGPPDLCRVSVFTAPR